MNIRLVCLLLIITNLKGYAQQYNSSSVTIANGQMPNIAKDKSNNIHIVYGTGDSIMHVFSKDGVSFTAPDLVAVLPELFASAMRGPQIAAGSYGLVIVAPTHNGNLFSYQKQYSGQWSKAVKVNDVNEVAKEALIGLSSDNVNTYAVWLSAKSTKGQNVFGARSSDGGKTWSKNNLVYESPDSSVCECCKPSVAVKDNKVFVMFRNWLGGNRDLYLIKTDDGGRSFGPAQKLGKGNWKLDGCPMDGGGLVIDSTGTPQTVWRREGNIYASTSTYAEVILGKGRSCTIELVGGRNTYAWSEGGNVVVLMVNGKKVNLGKGSLPLLKALNNNQLICVFQNDKQIHVSLL